MLWYLTMIKLAVHSEKLSPVVIITIHRIVESWLTLGHNVYVMFLLRLHAYAGLFDACDSVRQRE